MKHFKGISGSCTRNGRQPREWKSSLGSANLMKRYSLHTYCRMLHLFKQLSLFCVMGVLHTFMIHEKTHRRFWLPNTNRIFFRLIRPVHIQMFGFHDWKHRHVIVEIWFQLIFKIFETGSDQYILKWISAHSHLSLMHSSDICVH